MNSVFSIFAETWILAKYMESFVDVAHVLEENTFPSFIRECFSGLIGQSSVVFSTLWNFLSSSGKLMGLLSCRKPLASFSQPPRQYLVQMAVIEIQSIWSSGEVRISLLSRSIKVFQSCDMTRWPESKILLSYCPDTCGLHPSVHLSVQGGCLSSRHCICIQTENPSFSSFLEDIPKKFSILLETTSHGLQPSPVILSSWKVS